MAHEVTIECADNGYVVRSYADSKKGEPGRSVRKVASGKPEALKLASGVLDGAGEDTEKQHRGARMGRRSVKRRSTKRA